MRYVPDTLVRQFDHTPIWLRSVASTLYGYRKERKELTQSFWRYLAELEETQWWPSAKLQELQCDRLRALVRHAAANVPYYRKSAVEHGWNPSQIQTPDDLRRIPVLTKEIIRREGKNLLADGSDVAKLRSEATSGTTGTPFIVFMDDATYLYVKAMQWQQHRWFGYSHREWAGMCAGYQVIPLTRSQPPFWITNRAGKQIHFSAYHLKEQFLGSYADKIESSGIQFLQGYPSAIGLIARYIARSGRVIPLKGVILSSEPVEIWHREAIRAAFRCPIINYFAQGERTLTAMNCPSTDDLHVRSELAILEPPAAASNDGHPETIVTCLTNFSMPLIRYNTGDRFERSDRSCTCGRSHPLVKSPDEPHGRGDAILSMTGSAVPAPAFNFPIHNVRGISMSQIVQPAPDGIVLKLVTDETFDPACEGTLIEKYRSMLGRGAKVRVEHVQDIERTPNGKYKFTKSLISDPLQSTPGQY